MDAFRRLMVQLTDSHAEKPDHRSMLTNPFICALCELPEEVGKQLAQQGNLCG